MSLLLKIRPLIALYLSAFLCMLSPCLGMEIQEYKDKQTHPHTKTINSSHLDEDIFFSFLEDCLLQNHFLKSNSRFLFRSITPIKPDIWNKMGPHNNVGLLDQHRLNLAIIPPSIGNLTNLTELDVSHNGLESLPNEFGRMVKLKIIKLNYNKLLSLPETFGNLTNLNTLRLENNDLTALPETFQNLTNLGELSLYNNKLSSLKDSFCKLISLTKLWLYDNNLTSLPIAFGNLKRLQNLSFSNNPLIFLPSGVNIRRTMGMDLEEINILLKHCQEKSVLFEKFLMFPFYLNNLGIYDEECFNFIPKEIIGYIVEYIILTGFTNRPVPQDTTQKCS